MLEKVTNTQNLCYGNGNNKNAFNYSPKSHATSIPVCHCAHRSKQFDTHDQKTKDNFVTTKSSSLALLADVMHPHASLGGEKKE